MPIWLALATPHGFNHEDVSLLRECWQNVCLFRDQLFVGCYESSSECRSVYSVGCSSVFKVCLAPMKDRNASIFCWRKLTCQSWKLLTSIVLDGIRMFSERSLHRNHSLVVHVPRNWVRKFIPGPVFPFW